MPASSSPLSFSSRARILVPAAKRQKLEKKKRLGVQMGTGPLPVVVGCTPSSHQMVGTSSSSGFGDGDGLLGGFGAAIGHGGLRRKSGHAGGGGCVAGEIGRVKTAREDAVAEVAGGRERGGGWGPRRAGGGGGDGGGEGDGHEAEALPLEVLHRRPHVLLHQLCHLVLRHRQAVAAAVCSATSRPALPLFNSPTIINSSS
ncbi:hypothetical protein B296_00009065 [Ensete ventricosum]|uniref:Uncharacterized protein n=1 Tax=Ensete ventricosum TaxID=4639 RepID=A0A426ZNZ7_ENSVE|nr:hypothetical protein B296_00009065 [Ensete ventricosum]